MKTKVFLNGVFILLLLSSSCSRDDLFLEREALSPVGDKFMQIVHSSPDWESQWAKIQEIGRPMPNDAVFVYISCSGAYSIIPILSKNSKEIEGLAFYPLVTDDNSERLPKIIPKDAINRDFASRIFIKSESFSPWEKRGYTLSVKLDPLDYRMFSSPLTKSSGSAFPFQFTVRYDSSYDDYTMVQDVKHVFESAPNLLPRGIELHYEWESYYAIMIIDRAPSDMKGEEIASLCLSCAKTGLYSIQGVLSVEIIPLWDTDSGGGGGGGSGGSVTPPDPVFPCPHGICSVCKKYIGTSTRSFTCNNQHNFCKTGGNCQLEVSLTIPYEVTLGESYNVNLNLSPSDIATKSIQYKVWREGSIGCEYPLPNRKVTNFSFRATVPGTWNFSATVTYGDNKSETCTTQIKHNFPTVDMIKNNSSVIAAMNSAWEKTKTLATSTQSGEVGFIIYMKTTLNGFTYDCGPVITNVTNYGERPFLTLSGYADNPNVSVSSPLEGGKYYVADFHTHPPLSNMPKVEGVDIYRDVGPSRSTATDPREDTPGPNGIPSFVYDYIGDDIGQHRSTDNINSDAKIYTYGGTQRKNNY